MIPTLQEALTQRGYETLTPVQEACTDEKLGNADLLVSAQTGSGKTVGFGLAIGPTILREDGMFPLPGQPLALVVAPTRELAFQVKRELDWLYEKAGVVMASCVGGMDARDERRALQRGAHIVVGTPGRLRDHLERGALDLSAVKAVVLDEADEMLDLGFKDDLEFILSESNDDRRTLLFSATVAPAITKIATQYQKDAVRVDVKSNTKQHADISYQLVGVADHDQENAMVNMLLFHDASNAIIFANTRVVVARLTARLSNRGFSVVSLSGELSQQERSHALQAMRDGRARVCVATDVAARGIDLPNLDLVIHAELPTNAESLLHRSGRTGRAGRKGVSALIVPPKMRKRAERLLGWAKITPEFTKAPTAEEITARDEERLLDSDLWNEEPNEAQTAFAAKLLERQSPERIAAAYLALYQQGRSAPEDLSNWVDRDPPKREARERASFGPSKWVSMSIGRMKGAEPRWLMPMICRAGDIDKTVIGAIRIRYDETFVEIHESAIDGFWKAIGDGKIEDGVEVTAVNGTPDLSPEPRRELPKRGGGDRDRGGDRGGDRGERKPRAPREDRKPRTDWNPDGPKPERDERPRPAPRHDAEPRDHAGAVNGLERKPRSDKKPYGDKPKGKFGDKKPYGDKPKGKFGDKKPYGDKPKGSYGEKSETRPSPKAADTSKRFTPPGGKGKPRAAGGKPAGKYTPRRDK
ncbi:ATP-dependent RNA helicase DeaD [Aquimixticola soesokkakensis]|uniref:ATP-dependent RNA helicase DeaD n=1 Tax=Aquimixticola soesokkakensis TaxID=1519096 RepID=A0A1Y5SR13_9RHOB|nr:DEAD/DEAH box helicase [Aquimixticola soesokkakensis]SLN45762.1 ATP-dependent RNA helicase DeaD [Aquimixticola soesokkakensis]